MADFRVSRRQMEASAFAVFGRAAACIGRADFHETLLEATGRLFAHDLCSMVRYSRFSGPDFLVRGDYGPHFVEFYEANLYPYDPFYRYWREIEEPGVIALSRLATTEADRNRYVQIVLAEMRITDEIGFFLPPVGRSSVALFYDRCGGRYGGEEIALAQMLYPLLAGLHQAHVNTVLGGPAGEGGMGLAIAATRPMRILDRERHEVFANAAWKRFAADHAGDLDAALSGLAASGLGQARVCPGLILHRAPLSAAFGIAPGGWTDTIEEIGLAPARAGQPTLPESLAQGLTRREQEIVQMILQGYPTHSIADRLGLSRGTVKNYRRRIYDKLDITTEREIFLCFIAAVTGR
jgi:DNA-binding CsgD family transcriptional regulator